MIYRVLGKFGGGNRKMMIEPQRLEYVETDLAPPAIIAHFQEHSASIEFPVEKVLKPPIHIKVCAYFFQCFCR